MTKLKNTKKGMAKKALSISLVAAMLATSNVPVWAAEFTDGTDAVVEAPVVEEFAAEAPVEEEVPAVETKAGVTVSGKLTNTHGWGFYADVEKFSTSGLLDNDQINVEWKVGDNIVASHSNVQLSEFKADFAKTSGRSYFYIPTKEDCGKTLTLVLSRIDETDSKAFTFEASTTVGKRDISGYTTITAKNESDRPVYDGKEHKDANEWVSAVAFATTELTYAKDDFDVTVTGSKGLINVDSKISITAVPRDTEYYTGQVTETLDSGIQPKDYEDGDIKVEYTGAQKVYDGSASTLKKTDFKVTDALSNEVLDSEKLIWSINPSSVTNAGEYEVTIGLVEDGSANYESLNNVSVKASEKLTVSKLDLSTCEIFLGAVPANDKGNPVTTGDFTNVTITNAAGKKITNTLASLGLKVTSVQSNNGTAGTYTATVEANADTTNFSGKSTTATFRVYKNGLGGAAFDGKVSTTNQNPYATAAEEYTGEAITKDVKKLGNLVLDGTKLTPGVDYDTNFVYKNNTNAGTAEFIVKGLNTYAGSELTITFQINKASVSADDVKAAEKVTFNDTIVEAKEYAPELTVVGKNGATPAKKFTLEKDKDYTVKYTYATSSNGKDFVEVQTGKNGNEEGNYVHSEITITNENFKGGADTFNVYSKITKPQLTDWTVSTVQPSYTYTGETIIPELIVKNGTKEMELGVDYEIKSVAEGKDVGTATVLIVGKGDYDKESTATTTFEITPAKTEDLVVSVDDMEYTGQQVRPSFTNGIDGLKLGKVTISNSLFNISYPDSKNDNKEIGTGTFTLTPKTNNKNFTGSKTVTFKIVGKKVTGDKDKLKVYDENGKEVNLSQDLLYNGKAHTFAKVEFSHIYTDPVTHKSVALEEGKDFEIKYFHNVYGEKAQDTAAEGTAYIAVIGKGSYAGDGTSFVFEDENGQKVNAIAYRTFNIDSVALTNQNVTVSNGTYAEGMPVKPVVKVSYGKDTLTLEEGKDYKLTGINSVYTEPTTTKKYTVNVAGINGYTGTTDKNFAWGIDKKDLADCDVTAYKDAASDNAYAVVMNGAVRVASDKYVVTDNGNGTVTITPAKDSKYYVGSKTVAISNAEDKEKPAAPMITDVQVKGNNATVILSGDSDGATGYDYVISKDRNCINNKKYAKVNKNILTTKTTFTYTGQGTYYAYCHAWKKVDGKKVFSDWSNAYPFVVTSITPEQPAITSVKVSKNTVKVTYTKSANATGYDLVLGKSMKKVNGEMRPVEYGKLVKKVYNGNTVTATFTKVPKGTYYVGLHAYNRTSEDGKKVFSPWSNAKKVVVK